MGQFLFPKCDHQRVVERRLVMTARFGLACSIRTRWALPIPDGRRFRCNAGPAQALLSIGEHAQQPAQIVVTVSPDARRVWRLWSLPRDIGLVRLIDSRLLAAGGIPADH